MEIRKLTITLALALSAIGCSQAATQPPQQAKQPRAETPLPAPLPRCEDPSLMGMTKDNRGATESRDCYHIEQRNGKFAFYLLMRGPYIAPKEKVKTSFPRFVSALEGWYAKFTPKPQKMNCTKFEVLPQEEIDKHGFGMYSVCEFVY